MSLPTPSGPASTPQEVTPSSTSSIPPKPPAPQQANNPFAVSQQNQALPAANPFAPTTPATFQQQQHQSAPTGLPQPVQPAASQLPKVSGLPIPGGARKSTGGPQIPRGGGRGGGSQRGRGGGHPGGRASLNASAENFLPGAKRPRGDSEAGNGPKRARGGGGPGS